MPTAHVPDNTFGHIPGQGSPMRWRAGRVILDRQQGRAYYRRILATPVQI